MRLYGAGGLSWMQSTSPLVQLNEERARAHADAAAVPVGVVMLKLGPFLDVFFVPPLPSFVIRHSHGLPRVFLEGLMSLRMPRRK